jgi:hypothetical protein
MHSNLDKRLNALEQAGGAPRYFVYYTGEDRFVLPGGRIVDSDTFATAVERAGRRAVIIRVQHAD